MNKVVTADDVVGEIRDGATIAIGGSSLSRKPMALVRALARSDRRNLRLIVNVGGPEVDLLIGTGKLAEVIFAFVGFEVMGLAPHFRRARQDGSVRFQEWTEFTVMAGLDATIKRVPFLPTHAGLGTDLLRVNAAFRTFQDPFEGQTLLAVPALRPDVALIHVNLADPQGNGVILGDGHIDVLCAKAARRTFLSAEQILLPERLQTYGRDVRILRTLVAGVVEAPWGAHFTGCAPDYRADLTHVQEYLNAARDGSAWHDYLERYIYRSNREYLRALGEERSLGERLRV
ncbi:MAG TPA: CoA-transferase [bacterium]|nr:CoA-transferase [bacterium]